jgi:hypothetical protein
MNITLGSVGALALVASAACFSPRPQAAPQPRATVASRCAADSNYQRLAFWVGDWEVFDSTGTRYAAQRVSTVLDACAITAEWTGPAGGKGMALSAFDMRSGDWKQVYTSNQIPSPSGVSLRKSDPTYQGPGIRFITLLDPAPGDRARTRVTIVPLDGHRALQHFENSRDGGETWSTVFKAEHRLRHAP